jgi:hypothetical protein
VATTTIANSRLTNITTTINGLKLWTVALVRALVLSSVTLAAATATLPLLILPSSHGTIISRHRHLHHLHQAAEEEGIGRGRLKKAAEVVEVEVFVVE